MSVQSNVHFDKSEEWQKTKEKKKVNVENSYTEGKNILKRKKLFT